MMIMDMPQSCYSIALAIVIFKALRGHQGKPLPRGFPALADVARLPSAAFSYWMVPRRTGKMSLRQFPIIPYYTYKPSRHGTHSLSHMQILPAAPSIRPPQIPLLARRTRTNVEFQTAC